MVQPMDGVDAKTEVQRVLAWYTVVGLAMTLVFAKNNYIKG